MEQTLSGPAHPDLTRGHRALGDLRGAGGSIARRRSIRRLLRRAAGRLVAAEVALGRLEGARAASIDALEREQAARGLAPSAALVMQPRTVNVLIAGMAACDTLLVSAALQTGYAAITPASALVLSGGIGIALVALGKKTGERLATFHRLEDQGARWGVLAALAATVTAIASVGLTLLRVAPNWAWPLLVMAVPAGSAALTWLTYNPPAAEVARREHHRRRAEKRARRRDRQFLKHIARHDADRVAAEQRFRTRLAPALRRAIADGGLAGDDLDGLRRIADALLHDNLPPSDAHAGLRDRRDRSWAVPNQPLLRPLPFPHAAPDRRAVA